MKNKKRSKKNNDDNIRRVSDFDALNSQLGSFDLEPPRVYRNNTQYPERRVRERSRTSPDRNGTRNTSASKIRNKNSAQRSSNQQRRMNNTSSEIRQRKKKNKKLSIIRISAVILAVIVLFVVLSLTVIFKINTITVSGNTKYSTEEILSVLPIEKEKNLFLVKTKDSEQILEQSLPYIFDVKVTRKLPATIIVNVTETQQVYSIKNQDTSFTLLDENLKVLETNTAKEPDKTIRIGKLTLTSSNAGLVAEIEKEQQKKDILAMTEAISKMKLENITAIASYEINSNTLTYDNRIVIRLGTTENCEDKIYSSLTAIEKLNETNPSAKGDMTVLDDKQVYFTEK